MVLISTKGTKYLNDVLRRCVITNVYCSGISQGKLKSSSQYVVVNSTYKVSISCLVDIERDTLKSHLL